MLSNFLKGDRFSANAGICISFRHIIICWIRILFHVLSNSLEGDSVPANVVTCISFPHTVIGSIHVVVHEYSNSRVLDHIPDNELIHDPIFDKLDHHLSATNGLIFPL